MSNNCLSPELHSLFIHNIPFKLLIQGFFFFDIEFYFTSNLSQEERKGRKKEITTVKDVGRKPKGEKGSAGHVSAHPQHRKKKN